MREFIDHKPDCEFWHDQYPWECSCGATERMPHSEWIRRRREAWEAKKAEKK